MEHQYRIITSGAGFFDRSGRGRLRLAGRDALPFLQALVSNDVLQLEPGRGVHAVYLTPQGRMIADLDVLNRGETVMVFTPDGGGAALAARFDSLIFAEDLTVADVSAQWTELAVVGGAAVDRIARLFQCDPIRLEHLSELEQFATATGFIFRSGEARLPAFHVVVPAAERPAIVEGLAALGAIEIAEPLAAAMRIEAGRPLWGVDMSTDTIPLEAGLLERSISTSKGCYVGQEVVIRILHRGGGRVARRLVVMSFAQEERHVPKGGAPIVGDGKEVGHVTSAAFSPARGRVLAMGYVHRDAAEVGRVLRVGDAEAEIVGFAG